MKKGRHFLAASVIALGALCHAAVASCGKHQRRLDQRSRSVRAALDYQGSQAV